MSEAVMLAMQGIGNLGKHIGTALEPITKIAGTTDTATRVGTTTGDLLTKAQTGFESAFGNLSPEMVKSAGTAISGISEAAGQIGGIAGPAMQVAPVATAIKAATTKPKTPKIKMPSGPSDPAIARSPATQGRGQGTGRRAPTGKRKSGYSSIG